MEDDDFTFPSPAAAATGAAATLPPNGLWPRLPTASSTLWPFSSSPSSPSAAPPPAVHTSKADDAGAAKEAAPASSGSGGQAVTAVAARRDEEEEEEEWMDQLWEHERDARAGEERMDLLWEDFNDELLLQLRRQRTVGTTSPAGDGGGGRSSPPDEEETSSSSPPGGLYGCTPTMLRASSRAGAVGQFYGRRGGRSRATRWELLMRLFQKLFAVDKSSPPAPCHHHHHRRHGSIYGKVIN